MTEYPKPKPRSTKSEELDDALVITEAEVEVEAEEVITSSASETYVPVAPPTVYSVVSADSVDSVSVSAIVYKNIFQKKSLSVHHLQRRLAEWGYIIANVDKDGYFGEPTRDAILAFQMAHGFVVTGEADMATVQAIFEGDTNVRVVA